VLLLGSETSGLAKSLVEMCTDMVTIPMRGYASSLNIVGAASILLHAIERA
jgi:23S rRNA (guanosine2251-2'-O)-methyltransferase